MKKKKFQYLAKSVIELEIKALQKLKKSIDNNFDKAVNAILQCNSKVIICGVGKSRIIANKISATFSSIGTPSFSLSANDCSHGDMGSIDKNDLVILLSYSGNSSELKNIINYVNRNNITLIGITSKKNSDLYKNSDIKLLTPEVKEAGLDIVPTSSTINQLSIGDALAISTLKNRNFKTSDFKKFHPSGSLGEKLRTVEDLMITGKKIPFILENSSMKNALRTMTNKKLGTLIVIDNKENTKGIVTDGQIRRFNQKYLNINNFKVKDVMTKNPIKVEKDMLVTKALSIMNENKITSLCIFSKKNKSKTIGVIHIHTIIGRNVY